MAIRNATGESIDVAKDDPFFLAFFDNSDMGMVLYNHRSQVCFCNKVAKEIIESSPALVLRHGTFRATTMESDIKLRRAISNAVTKQERAAVGIMHPEVFPTLPVLVAPFGLPEGESDIAAVVSIRPSWQVVTATLAELKSAYGFTLKEADVAIRLANANNAAEIAHDRNVTESTVNTQTQAVYNKLDVHSQTKVMRILALSAVTTVK